MGEHPVDIVDGELTASESFAWLEEIFKTIEQECFKSADAKRSLSRIAKLAGIGELVSADRNGYFGARHIQMYEAVGAAGLDTASVTVEEVNHG